MTTLILGYTIDEWRDIARLYEHMTNGGTPKDLFDLDRWWKTCRYAANTPDQVRDLGRAIMQCHNKPITFDLENEWVKIAKEVLL